MSKLLILCEYFAETIKNSEFGDKTLLKILGKTETRPRALVSFFTRPRQEPTFNKEKHCIFDLILLITTNLD